MLGKPIEALYGKQYTNSTVNITKSAAKSEQTRSSVNLGKIKSDTALKRYDENGMLELYGSAEYMNMTPSAHDSYIKASKKVKTYKDFESYLKRHGLELDTSTERLKKDRYDSDLPKAVKGQVDLIIAAIEQYSELGGLSRLKKVHIWDKNLEVQGQYVYNALGENDPEAYEIFFRQGSVTPHQVMHEFAHAFADSMKPEGYDCVSWSAKLNDMANLSRDAKAYMGAATDVYEAEKFADNFSYAFTASGKSFEKNTQFYYSVMDVLRRLK
jgi:hypothetical protein